MKIKIAEDFSRIPGARFLSEGDFPGEVFREKVLLPKLLEAIEGGHKLDIDLDGTAGLGTSFLEESFGGLIRVDKIDYNQILKTIVLISIDDPDYKDEIMDYLKEAYEKENN
jgi:hypothetical protein